MLKRQLHGACRAFAIRWWSRHMISIGRKTVSYNFTVNLRATRFGMLQFLHDHNSCALAHDETVAVVEELEDRKSTRLNSSHVAISYAVFCLKKKNEQELRDMDELYYEVPACRVTDVRL